MEPRNDLIRILAHQAMPGMILCDRSNPFFDTPIYDVEPALDGGVKITHGDNGTGTTFYGSEDYICIKYPARPQYCYFLN